MRTGDSQANSTSAVCARVIVLPSQRTTAVRTALELIGRRSTRSGTSSSERQESECKIPVLCSNAQFGLVCRRCAVSSAQILSVGSSLQKSSSYMIDAIPALRAVNSERLWRWPKKQFCWSQQIPTCNYNLPSRMPKPEISTRQLKASLGRWNCAMEWWRPRRKIPWSWSQP